MKISTAIFLCLTTFGAAHAAETGLRSLVAENAEAPDFLSDNEIPPGLRDNPGQALKVDFKPGRKAKFQNAPPKEAKSKKIRDLNGKTINLEKTERINPFDEELYEVNSEGSHVIHKKTGDTYFLGSYFYKKGNDQIEFAVDENDDLMYVRVSTRPKPNKFKATVDPEMGNTDPVPAQNFQREGNFLIGFFDDDLDLDALNAKFDFGNEVMEDEVEDENEGAKEHPVRTDPGGRRLEAINYPRTMYSHTCNAFDHIRVNLQLDAEMEDFYGGPFGGGFRALLIFNGAKEMFWTDLCVELRLGEIRYSHNSPAWMASPHRFTSGCNGYGAMQAFANMFYPDPSVRDVWHLLSGVPIGGCTWLRQCQSSKAFGVGHMTWTDTLRLQQVWFARILAHNLGATILPFTYGLWVMEPWVTTAPWGFSYYVTEDEVDNYLDPRPWCGAYS